MAAEEQEKLITSCHPSKVSAAKQKQISAPNAPARSERRDREERRSKWRQNKGWREVTSQVELINYLLKRCDRGQSFRKELVQINTFCEDA